MCPKPRTWQCNRCIIIIVKRLLRDDVPTVSNGRFYFFSARLVVGGAARRRRGRYFRSEIRELSLNDAASSRNGVSRLRMIGTISLRGDLRNMGTWDDVENYRKIEKPRVSLLVPEKYVHIYTTLLWACSPGFRIPNRPPWTTYHRLIEFSN